MSDIKQEVYRDVAGYEGFYKVSNFGNVMSVKRRTKGRWGNLKTTRGGILKPFLIHGYKKVDLSANGVARNHFVHRLVAKAFLPNDKALPCVNHLDSDRGNSHVSNLEWCTSQENTRHMIKQGRNNPLSGIDHPQSRKTHCLRGHEFSEVNTYRPTSGGRYCRTCRTLNSKKRKSEEYESE